MRAVDTNVLLQLVVGDDPRQLAMAEAFVSKGAWVSHLVLAETVWVLASVYERSAPTIASVLDMLLNHRAIAIQEPDVVTLAAAQFRAQPALGFSDCLILEIARKAGHLPLGTFDRALSKRDGAQRLIKSR